MKNLFRLVMMLVLISGAASAAESSSDNGFIKNAANKNSISSTQNTYSSLMSGIGTTLNGINSTLQSTKACQAQGKLWNGTACVDSASNLPHLAVPMGLITSPTFVKATTPIGYGQCCNNSIACYVYVNCGCSAAQQLPKITFAGSMVLIEPQTCTPKSLGYTYIGLGYCFNGLPTFAYLYCSQ